MQLQIPYHLYLERYKYKYLTLYHALRDSILSGTLPHEAQLPSSREMAELYQISRGVVSQVYEMLAAEGYVHSEVGQGTFISYQHQEHSMLMEQEPALALSEWGKRLDRTLELPSAAHKDHRNSLVDFGIGYTDSEQFPLAEWNRTLYRSVREWTEKNRQEAFVANGYVPLRSAIAQMLRRSRGIDVDAEDVAIVNGSMQAIALLVQLLLNPNETVVMEDPGYSGIRHAVETVGAHLHMSPIDEQGIRVEDWDARLLFVTPSRQFPTGSVLSLERRQELLHWAVRRNAILIEDDYDSEFRYKGRPIEPLKALDRHGRVVYLGTFSKTMFTDIRIGYVVLPTWLREPFTKARHLFEPHPTSLIQQRALAVFINSGAYERHLRRMKRVYSQKHKLCLEAIQAYCGDWFDVVDSDAGLHVFAWWKHEPERFDAFVQACLENGIRIPKADRYQASNRSTPAALFGFPHLQEEKIRWAFATMANLLKQDVK